MPSPSPRGGTGRARAAPGRVQHARPAPWRIPGYDAQGAGVVHVSGLQTVSNGTLHVGTSNEPATWVVPSNEMLALPVTCILSVVSIVLMVIVPLTALGVGDSVHDASIVFVTSAKKKT